MYKEIQLDKILFYKRKNRYELFYEKYGEPVYLQLSKGYLSKKIENTTKYIWLGYFSNTPEKNKTFNYLTKLKNYIENKCSIKLETFFYDNGICIPCQNNKENLQLEIYVRQNEILCEDNLNNFPEKSFVIPIIYIENIVYNNDKWRINIKLIQICVFPLYQKFGKCVIEFDNNKYLESKEDIIVEKNTTILDGHINIKLSEHPLYSKYFKMCKIGIPKAAIIQKMMNEIDNIDAHYILNRDPDEIETIKLVMTEEHDYYSRFFKMIKMGIPKVAVQQKMILEGIDINYLDKGKDLIPNIAILKKKDMFSELLLKKVKNNEVNNNHLNKNFNSDKINSLIKNTNSNINLENISLNKKYKNDIKIGISMEELLRKRNTIFQMQKSN
jgi:hypothetical protein